MDQAAPPSNVLAYADLPARHGIQYDRRAEGVLIVLPPPPWWRRPDVLSPLILCLFIGLPNFIQAYDRGKAVMMIVFATVTVVLAAVSVAAIPRRRSVVLELTADALRMENVRPLYWTDGPGASVARRLSYPRREVYDIHFVQHSGNIVVRVHGQEMIEFLPARDPQVNRWIAEQLRAALGLPA